MKKLILILLAVPAGAAGWGRADTAWEAAFFAVHAADWGTTLDIQCEEYQENNPLLSKCPSRGEVNRYFAFTGAAHAAVAYALPNPYRRIWQVSWIAVQVDQYASNWRAGVRFNF